jgi:hypothetical protein
MIEEIPLLPMCLEKRCNSKAVKYVVMKNKILAEQRKAACITFQKKCGLMLVCLLFVHARIVCMDLEKKTLDGVYNTRRPMR